MSEEVDSEFDNATRSLYCKTPKFDNFEGQANPSLILPCECVISVTTDGINYSECEEKFHIYHTPQLPNTAATITPKCGSVKGGTELTILLDIDPDTSHKLFNLTVGLQPKRRKIGGLTNKTQLQQSSLTKNQSVEETVNDETMEGKQRTLNASQYSSAKGNIKLKTNFYIGSAGNVATTTFDGPVNPLDITINDPEFAVSKHHTEIDADNWVCSAGFYDRGKITCILPELEEYESNNLQFNLDIALNGQQFTGHPLKFRYYDVKITSIEPALGPSQGGTNIRLLGSGLYDSPIKRIKFTSGDGTREVAATWERRRKAICCVVPPLTWLFGGEEVSQEVIADILKNGVKMSLTFNNQEWVDAPDYKYHDIVVERVAYENAFAEEIESEEEKQKLWIAEEAPPQPPAEATEEEVKKWEEEQAKKVEDENEEVTTSAKRFGSKIYVYGMNFIKNEFLKVRFTLGQKVVDVVPIFKNSLKLALEIPDMGEEIEVGQHQVQVDVSVNGQNFTNSGKTFLYNAIDRNMSEEELKKLQEAEEKAKGKGGKKK